VVGVRQQMADEVGRDEPCPAGDQYALPHSSSEMV
jgi:hypothetical protein